MLLGILLLLIASYQLAIRKTFMLKDEYAQLRADAHQFKDIPQKLSMLSQKEVYYDSILEKINLVETSVQNNLLYSLNQEAKKNGTQVMDFNPPHVLELGENTLFTFSFSLNGRFADIIKTVHAIEQKGSFGEIVHLDFEKKNNYKTNKSVLGATVLIQLVK